MNNDETVYLMQAYFLDIRKKTQGVKNSKLKRKTQNSSQKFKFPALLRKNEYLWTEMFSFTLRKADWNYNNCQKEQGAP